MATQKKIMKITMRDEITHWEGLFPACSYYGWSNDGYVEVSSLLLHQVLSQGFSVGVGVGTLPDQLGSQSRHQLVIHPAGQKRKKHTQDKS